MLVCCYSYRTHALYACGVVWWWWWLAASGCYCCYYCLLRLLLLLPSCWRRHRTAGYLRLHLFLRLLRELSVRCHATERLLLL